MDSACIGIRQNMPTSLELDMTVYQKMLYKKCLKECKE